MKHERQWWAEHLARLASSHGQAAQRAYRAGWLATARVEARSAWHYANRADGVMTRCEIQWVDGAGRPTPDTHSAVGTVQCLGYPCSSNPAYKPEPSREFPICADHLLQMPHDGRWIFRPYVDEVPS